MKLKDIIAILLVLFGYGIGFVCVIIMAINRFKNPDMTDMRLTIEYSNIVVTGLLAFVGGAVGIKILGGS